MVQRGRNQKYPNKIEIWRPGDKVPEWLSDVAKIDHIDPESGEKKLKTFSTISLISADDKCGYGIYAADGKTTLVKTETDKDYICYGDRKLFSLTEKQIELLYKDEDKK